MEHVRYALYCIDHAFRCSDIRPADLSCSPLIRWACLVRVSTVNGGQLNWAIAKSKEERESDEWSTCQPSFLPSFGSSTAATSIATIGFYFSRYAIPTPFLPFFRSTNYLGIQWEFPLPCASYMQIDSCEPISASSRTPFRSPPSFGLSYICRVLPPGA